MPPSPPEPREAAFLARIVGWVLLGAGSIALIAAGALMVEKVRMLEDPTRVPACTIDAVLACGAVMSSDQAEAFGVPNPLLGIAGFAAMMTIGLAVLSGATFPRWFWLTLQVGVTFAVGFVHWLFFQTVYRIGALCPYCMAVWVATIVAFVYVSLHNVAHGVFPSIRGAAIAVRYHGVVVTAWLTILTLLIGEAFWDHWRTKL